jgi:uncharacterized protein YndB with AHSA1/START domain
MPHDMVKIEDEIRIDAPAPEIWELIKDPTAHARWHPFLTEIRGGHGLGQVRTCTVLLGGKTGRTTERCVEDEEASRITWLIETDSTGFGRMVSDWRAGFALTGGDHGTAVTANSTFRPNNLLVRAMLPLIRHRFHRTQRAILNGLKASITAPAIETAPLDRDAHCRTPRSRSAPA